MKILFLEEETKKRTVVPWNLMRRNEPAGISLEWGGAEKGKMGEGGK